MFIEQLATGIVLKKMETILLERCFVRSMTNSRLHAEEQEATDQV